MDPTHKGQQLYKQLLTNVSEGLTFSEDVLWALGPDGIPYSKTDFSRLFCAVGPLSPSAHLKSRKQGKRKPLPCHAHPDRGFMMTQTPVLPPLPSTHHHLVSSKETSFTIPVCGKSKLIKRTGLKEVQNVHSNKGKTTEGRKEDIMHQWIVDVHMTSDCIGQYRAVKDTSLVNDENECSNKCSGFYDVSKSSPEPRALQNSQMESLLPVYDRFFLKSDKSQGFVSHPPQTNPVISKDAWGQDYNIFSGCADELSGKNPTPHSPKHTEFPERLYPQSHRSKLAENHVYDRDNSKVDLHTANPGMQNTGTPEYAHLPIKARPPYNSGQETDVLEQPMLEFSALHYAVEGWRNAYKIKTSCQSVTTEGLKMALANQQCQVRMAAIAKCASIAVDRPEAHPDSAQNVRNGEVEPVLQKLLPSLLSALNDPEEKVQMAAAICQYAIGTPNDRAQDILLNALHKGTGADSWVAAQCLVMGGNVDQDVLERLLSQHLLSRSLSDQEQAATLLANISTKTTLVRFLLAENLNCTNWRNRVQACRIISQLKCPITKDVSSKLLHLMVDDCRGLVRVAAAQALKDLGMSDHIHNDLRNKLDNGSVHQRVEALVFIGQQKIMTRKLLPSFMHCFNDELIVIRKQACLTAASLMMKDDMDDIKPNCFSPSVELHGILNQLIRLMQNDSSYNVKVAAINALGTIGCDTPTLQELLLSALRYEKESNTRIAACEALRSLAIKDPKIQHLLQELFILEADPQVQRRIEGLIKSYNYNLEENKSMVHRITKQVRSLCTTSIITQKVLLLEQMERQKCRNSYPWKWGRQDNCTAKL